MVQGFDKISNDDLLRERERGKEMQGCVGLVTQHKSNHTAYPYDPNKRKTFDPSATSAVTCTNKLK